MRKGLLILLVLLVIGIISMLAYFSVQKLSQKEDRTQNISSLPDLSYFDISGNEVNLKDAFNGEKVILILFNSECEHCTYEAKAIREDISSFKDVTLIFLSMESLEKVIGFSRVASLDGVDRVTFGHVEPDKLESVFKNVRYPNIFLYNDDGSLIKEFKGETKIDLILEAAGV